MSILKVSRMGHPVLRKKVKPVPPAEITAPPIQRLIDDMTQTMVEYNGVGPGGSPGARGTAPVRRPGRPGPRRRGRRRGASRPEMLALINPEIMPVSRHVEEDWEGCLSIPDLRGLVPRHRDIKVRAYDRTGRRIEIQASGFMARVIQHETDHLDGVLFLDRMKSLDSLSFLEEYARYHAKTGSRVVVVKLLPAHHRLRDGLHRPAGVRDHHPAAAVLRRDLRRDGLHGGRCSRRRSR